MSTPKGAWPRPASRLFCSLVVAPLLGDPFGLFFGALRRRPRVLLGGA
jgi:hypothetical protein